MYTKWVVHVVVKSYLIKEENNMKKNKQQCVCGNSQNLDGSCDGSHSLNK
jgi:CDGSH-type Zn-finger protein